MTDHEIRLLNEAKAMLIDIIDGLKPTEDNERLSHELTDVWRKINEAIWTLE